MQHDQTVNHNDLRTTVLWPQDLLFQSCNYAFLERRIILQVAMQLVYGKYCLSMLEKCVSAYYDSQTHNLIIRRYQVTQPSLSQSTPYTHTQGHLPSGLNVHVCINLSKEQQLTEYLPATLSINSQMSLSSQTDWTICKIHHFTTFPLLCCQHLGNIPYFFFPASSPWLWEWSSQWCTVVSTVVAFLAEIKIILQCSQLCDVDE